ncbi:hypothetical protein [Roseateles saccharophilus]|uniref:hypothetical protein n=1 Tax=Roseateles saccharophilus TaxID=304 RepID=UPI00286A15BA|nr:hypothetical protein [Roseateles saccharophilus]
MPKLPFDPQLDVQPGTRAAGIAIALATVVSTVFVALDESGGGQGQLAILQSIAQLAALKAAVHGVAIASLCAYAFGYTALTRRLSLQRPAVLAGLAAYLMGCVALVGATVVDGFVIPHLAADAIVGSPMRLQVGYELVHAAGIALTDAAKIGWLLQAAGALAWAGVLMGEAGLARVVGIVGAVANLAMGAAVLGAGVNMSMTAILTILLAQLVWNVAAALWLVRAPRARTGASFQSARMSGSVGA